MIRFLQHLALLVAAMLWICTVAVAQPAAAETGAATNGQLAQPAQSDIEALRRVIGLLSSDEHRAALLEELRALDRTMQTLPLQHEVVPPEPVPGERAQVAEEETPEAAAPEILTEGGLIGAISATVTTAVDTLSTATFGMPVETKLENAANEIGQRVERGGNATAIVNFLIWAVPGILAVVGVYAAFSRSRWVRARFTLAVRPTVSGPALAKQLIPMVLLGFLPLLIAFAAAWAWVTQFAPTWREGQIFLALLSPFLAAMLVRKVVIYGLILLGPSRGWRLVAYATRRLLPWIMSLVVLATTTNLLREIAVRSVVGRNVADIAALTIDLVIAVVAIAFALRHRLTVRSMLVRGRTKEGAEDSRASNVLASAFRLIASWWHVILITFVIANVAARILGLGQGSFIRESAIAILYLVGALALLSLTNTVFLRMAKGLERGKPTMRSAILRRYLDILHLLAQIVIVGIAGLWMVDIWGFNISGWLQSEAGRNFSRPVFSLIIIPLLAYAIWTTIDTAITSQLEGTDARGRARERSARVKTLLPLIRNLILVILLVISVIAVLANIGINVMPLLAGAGILGLAFSFGAQQLVQDVITGFFIIIEDTIAIGETVSTGDRTGVVEGITIRTLRIRDGNGTLHSIPFGQIKALQNSSRGYGVFNYSVGLSFGSDVDAAIQIIGEVGRDLLTDANFGQHMIAPIEIWGVDSLGSEGVLVKGAIRCRPNQQWGVGRELYRRLKQRFDAAGIRFFASQMSIAITPPDSDASSLPLSAGEQA